MNTNSEYYNMQHMTVPLELREARMITSKVKHFTFAGEALSTFSYLPGQFITIHIPQEQGILKRSYSIANAPGALQLEFAAGYVANGPGTEYLYRLSAGDQIRVSGPYGRLLLKEGAQRYILIATSTGVTPYRAMIPELERQLTANPQLEVVLLQGVQKREEALYLQDFLTLRKRFPQQVVFRGYFSREQQDDLSADQYAGYVQHAFPSLNLDPQNDLVYLCGNPSMVDDAFNILKEYFFTTQQIIREKYLSR